MSYGKISKKQSEILEYMKNEILNRGFPPSVRGNLRGSQFKVHFLCPLPSGDAGEKRLYKKGPHQTAGNRNCG